MNQIQSVISFIYSAKQTIEMSNPMSSLKKTKKPPLYLPEMSAPTPLSTFSSLSPRSHQATTPSPRENQVSSSMSNYFNGYKKSDGLPTQRKPFLLKLKFNFNKFFFLT